jgi:hypothetical protein
VLDEVNFFLAPLTRVDADQEHKERYGLHHGNSKAYVVKLHGFGLPPELKSVSSACLARLTFLVCGLILVPYSCGLVAQHGIPSRR